MLQTVRAFVRGGKIELAENVPLEEGTPVLVTILSGEDEGAFWAGASQSALAEVWENAEDDVYAQLLEK